MEFGFVDLGIDAGVVLDAFLAFYLILGSIGIGYFFLRTGFKKSDSIHKEYRIGWSIVFGLSYSSVVLVFSLGAGFFNIGGMGFSEFIFIFAGLVFAAGVTLLKARAIVLPQPKLVTKQVQAEKKEKQEKKELEQVIEFDKPKETQMEIIEAKAEGKKTRKESGVFGMKLFGEKNAGRQTSHSMLSKNTEPEFPPAGKPSLTMLDMLELSKKDVSAENKPPAKPMAKPVIAEEKLSGQKIPETPGKFAWTPGKKTEEKPLHPFGIFKKDLQKPAENKPLVQPAKPVEKPVEQPLAEHKLLPAPKRPDLKSIIPQKPKAPEPQPQIVQPKQATKLAPFFQPRQAVVEPKPVQRPKQIKPLEEKKDFNPLPEDKMDYFGLKEKGETREEKPKENEEIPENETPLQRLLREKREKIIKLRREKGGNQNE